MNSVKLKYPKQSNQLNHGEKHSHQILLSIQSLKDENINNHNRKKYAKLTVTIYWNLMSITVLVSYTIDEATVQTAKIKLLARGDAVH